MPNVNIFIAYTVVIFTSIHADCTVEKASFPNIVNYTVKVNNRLSLNMTETTLYHEVLSLSYPYAAAVWDF